MKYLDSYVVGQTRAKKVLAVGVWNHYLRVASNERSSNAAEVEESTVERHEESAVQEREARVVRLGKFTTTGQGETLQAGRGIEREKRDDGEDWTAQRRIEAERIAERARDPHGEAVRG